MSTNSSDDVQVKVVKRDIFVEPEWDKLSLSVNPILFKKFSGRPISSHIKCDNGKLKRKYEELIVRYGGVKVEDYIDMEDTTALMVLDDSVILYERPSFKVSYITDCILKDTLLHIGEYLHNQFSFTCDTYMNVIFWETETFQKKNLQPYADSSEEDSPKLKTTQTRVVYSRNEKVTILKFLLSRKRLSGLKGNLIWKKMEKRGVCPKRTYQSMKNHFLKTILSELDTFEFLSEIDKKMLRKS